MNIKKFFEIAKQEGLSAVQIRISKSTSTSVSLYHHDIDSFSVSDSLKVTAHGIYNGKFGVCRTEKLDNNAFLYLIQGIKESASLSEKEEEAEIFKGSEKYRKKNLFNKELAAMPIESKISIIREIEKKFDEAAPLISDVEGVTYEESETSVEIYNSYGLKLKDKGNYYIISAGINGKDETGKVFDSFGLDFGMDLSKFDMDKFVNEAKDTLVKKFGAGSIKAGKYPTVLKHDVLSSLINYFLSSVSSEEVQKKTSFLIGKLGTQVASKKLTIEERPLDPNIFYSYFDAEGVATYNKKIVDKGILKTYLYNLETAKKDGVTTTANAGWAGNKIGITTHQIKVYGSKKTFDEMISTIKNGVYITEVAGLGTGMNAQSGDFSCQAQGFVIEDGKITKPLTLITLSGNLLKMLNDIKALDNANEMHLSGTRCPNAYIKSMSIGGE